MFKKEHNILEKLTELQKVSIIFIYEPSENEFFQFHSISNNNEKTQQEIIIKDFEEKVSNKGTGIKQIYLKTIENLRIINSLYNESTKTLTLDLSLF